MRRAAVILALAAAFAAGLSLGLALAPATAAAPRSAVQLPGTGPAAWTGVPAGPARRTPAPSPASPSPSPAPSNTAAPASPAVGHRGLEASPRPARAASGVATWYAAPGGTAAAGPALRALLGPGWRGQRVQACSESRCVVVVLADFCQCYRGEARERLIDLSAGSFARLAPLSRGIVRVEVSRA